MTFSTMILLTLMTAGAATPDQADVDDLKRMMQQYEQLKLSSNVSDYERLQVENQEQRVEIAQLQAEKALLLEELERLRATCPKK